MIETWKPVVGYEGLYEVSDGGAVRSLDRVSVAAGQRLRGRPIRTVRAGRGYLQVGLWDSSGRRKNRYVHRVVLEAFAGAPSPGHEACHNNGDRQDNRLENLRWDSRSANHTDKRAHGTMPRGESHHHASIGEADVRRVLTMAAEGRSRAEISRSVGITTRHVGSLVRRELWAHVSL